MSLQESDAAAAAVQKTPNRISLAYLESQITDEEYLYPDIIRHMTICVLRVKNGFAAVGKGAPADPENFDKELGKKLAREDAIRQLWPLYAFALRCDMEGQSVEEDIKGFEG